MRALAYAKVNLALSVLSPRPDGFHRISGLFQTVSLTDEVEAQPAEEDTIEVQGGDAPRDESNLAWVALDAARAAAGDAEPLRLAVRKRIPSAAGLGGGSADAAAALALAASTYGLERDVVMLIAATVGSDVPFAFVGGTGVVSGKGEDVSPLPSAGGYAMAVVVPPVEVSTAAVYRRWDELDGPAGQQIAARHLPPALRQYAPLVNDLYPAAVSVKPAVEDWREELSRRWGVPVAMTGSGSGLFGFFATLDEAQGAAGDVPLGARAAEGVEPVPHGWKITDSEPFSR